MRREREREGEEEGGKLGECEGVIEDTKYTKALFSHNIWGLSKKIC